MRIQCKDQRGFSSLETILIIAVVLLLGAAGYLVYANHRTAPAKPVPPSAASTSGSKTPSSNTTSSGTAATPNYTSQAYFTIKEWGVRAAYNGNDTFTYKIDKNDSDQYFRATVISKELASQYPGCQGFGAGTIVRLSPTDGVNNDGSGPTAADYAKDHSDGFRQVGNYYYEFIPDQARCGDAPIIDQTKAGEDVKNAVTHFEALPS